MLLQARHGEKALAQIANYRFFGQPARLSLTWLEPVAYR